MVLTRSKTSGMDQQPGETTEAYETRMLDMVAEFKQRAAAATSARKKKDEEAEEQHRLAEQRQEDAEAARKAADERRRLRRDKILESKGDIEVIVGEWAVAADEEDGPPAVCGLATTIEHVSDLVATCAAQQEDILCVDTLVRKQARLIDELLDRVRRLEQQPTTATPAGPSNLTDGVNVLEIDVGTLKDGALATNQRIDQQICAAAASCLSGPQCAALCAHLHPYLAFYAPPPSPTDDEVAVGDILAYVSKVAREFRMQQYDDNNAPLLYVRIQVGQASCNALLDSGATRNFIIHSFIQRVGLGAQVRRKPNPTVIKLADGRTQQLLDHYVEVMPVYFAPHAREPVTFNVLDTDFNIILGMPWLASAAHTVNFHQRTLTVRDAFGAKVSCTIPLSHPSIRCQVVTAKSFQATCAYKRTGEIGLCFLRAVATIESSPTDLSSDPRVVRLLDEFIDIFESPTGVVPDRPISHEIILEAGVVPPKGCIYRMSEEELAVLCAQLDDLLDKGWIRPSGSPYGPLPRIDDLLEHLGDAKLFSKLDLKSGYHQISIHQQDRYKSVFKTWYGHFEWVIMPFGLTNAPTTFQTAMTNEFRAMLNWFVLVYLDDILVYSGTLEDHLEHLRRVLEMLCRAKYKANRDKCEFVRQEREYLGHFVTPESISPLSDKIQAIQEWPKSKNVTNVRSFLGLAGYYQRFIKGYSKIVAHLSKLQCEELPFDFDDNAWTSFSALEAALLSAEVLRIYDPLSSIRVTTDVSGYGIGVVLEQHDDVDWHPIEYFSKKVPAVHSIDNVRKKELLAFLRPLPVPLRRRERIAMDIIGPFPKHKTGMDGILMVVDRLTKFAMFLPCRYHAKAPKLAEVLLHTLIRPDQKDWVERLPDVELAYNSSIHPTIGMLPFEFEHGSPVTSPLDTIIPQAAESDDHLLFIRQMQELLVKARDQMAKTQQRMSQQANRQRLPCPFRAGDLVWVSTAEFSLEQDLLQAPPEMDGAWPIVAPAGDAPEGPSFVIQVPAHLPVYPVFHCSKLALYTPAEHDDFPGRRSQDPPSVDGFQEVGDIISQRRYGNRPTEYMVYFAYCTHKADRWLTRAELQATASDVLASYERKMQGKPVSSAPRRTRVQVPPSDRQLRP
ncbi:hypothetical protein CBR_g31395 [Chara braunii]|uniref:Reverse transcriptase domain-containing protein n=1 Tax=Chara braunii TaxID=69332 RepID=A0A388LEU7_CHABU|nr:hypothetical protein CBR_g31395 [Chara braunii]|eukprot:GBG80839.1 hypothetical protein CBR_g31395 [Chara braunii]